jgi:hypothetical protein
VLFPFLVMQPAMGAGIAASRTRNPGAARLQSLVTHAVFGLGLYTGGWIAHFACARRRWPRRRAARATDRRPPDRGSPFPATGVLAVTTTPA